MSSVYEDGTYLENNPAWHAGESEWKAKEIFSMLQCHNQQPKTIVEIGAGAGGVTNALSKLLPNSQFVGYDISPQAIAMALKNTSERVQFVLGDYFELSTEKFELAICADVFEHIDDYLGFLKKLAQKQGLTVFHVPLDLSLVSILMPSLLIRTRNLVGHLHYFSRKTAEATINDCGFKIMDSRITTGCLEFPDRGVKGRIFWLIRKIAYAINPEIASKLFGGFSLLVLAESQQLI